MCWNTVENQELELSQVGRMIFCLLCFISSSLILCPSGLTALSTSVIREYHYVKMLKTWTEAQSYCREKFTDLAAVESQSDNDRLMSVLQGLENYAWIGLYDNMTGWKWALGDADFNTEYSNWDIDQPNNMNFNESCTLMHRNGLWADVVCSMTLPAVCYDGKKDV
uniref:C-type lectin domain-containing protein n=1 Tax=Cyclopterus lumpus TaxID=8103 RepID=A0A8C2ZHS7_CYCLU